MLSSKPTRPISPTEVAEFHEHGVVKLAGIMPLDWIEFLKPAVDEAMADPGPFAEEYAKGDGRFFGDLDVSRRFDRFRRFVHESPAAEIMAAMLESKKINFFYDQLLVKEPGTSERTPWHQDQPYWAVRGRQVASIWLPLDPVGRDSAVQYVRGSHLWPEHNPHHFIDDSPYQGSGLPELPDIDAASDEHELLSWDLEPGDCIVFHAMIVHGAPGNRSTRHRRRAWATRWTGDDACYAGRAGEIGYPPFDPGLKDGDPMDSDYFPVIWHKQRRRSLIQ
jgi:ectoine hydroxylase-related dioxygenase (phytanoyl-CoA dioxygenase family)